MQKQSIFISYSHQDETYKDLATKFLKSAKMPGSFKAWSDRNIEIGSQWETEIGSAIDHAKAAIFLISENYKCLSLSSLGDAQPCVSTNDKLYSKKC